MTAEAAVRPVRSAARVPIGRWVWRGSLYAALVVLCAFWVYPFVWIISASLKTNAEIFTTGLGLIPSQLQLDNYVRAWQAASFGTYFMNTVIVSVGSTVLVVIVTAMAGYCFGRYPFPGKRIFAVLLVATIFVPTGFSIIPIFDLAQRLGLTNSLLGLVIAETNHSIVLFLLLFGRYFSTLPRELEEAAVMDGAGFARIFFQIMLPLAKPVIATVAILQFIASWNSFFFPLVFTLARPDLRTLGVGMIAFLGEYSIDWAGMAAAATISVVPAIVVFVLLQRLFVGGLAGAIKQ
ncbi:MAG: carbohydrate ABC transporter permease [Candidatus Rokuibacteriota bacterium]